jgi:hypothetical protein
VKQQEQLVRTAFRGVRANSPARRVIAAELGRGKKSCFYSCFQLFLFAVGIVVGE